MRMNKLKSRIGMTMAEMLIVVAIIAVLGGVAFISVWNHQRSLGQLERDGIAKEIFVAAQNHLTAAFGEGYLGLEEPESNSAPNPFGSKDSTGAYYYVVNSSDSSYSTPAVFEQMLPFGSVDETVRAGGSYIVRYQKETGTVMDVFYCSTSGSPTQYNHLFFDSDDYDTVISKAGDANKSARKTYVNGSILGWYGGAEAATLATLKLDPPTIKVVNGDKLYVEVTDTNSAKTSEGAMLQLIIEGMSGGAKKVISLSSTTSDPRVEYDLLNSKYTVILDDITTPGFHFAELGAYSGSFIPGENIKIQAVAYSTSALANITYSASNETNSLFGSLSDTNTDKTFETADIYSIRHLENLDVTVSNLDSAEIVASTDLEKFKIASATQTDDLNWSTFTGNSSSVTVYGYGSVNSVALTTSAGNYYPIQPDYPLIYDGKSHSISNVQASGENAGLFGSTTKVSAISNLELIDFSITGTTSAGALAGTLDGCTVTNVLARNSEATSAAKITATGNAGGLVGELTSGTVQYSAAAVIVGDSSTKPTNAGGLIGSAGGTITGCYSGGHTARGSYNEWVKNNTHPYDVTGGTVGGLVGTYTGSASTTIENSYSTCSVSGTTTAGGFAGSASGSITTSGSITNCYATGLVDGTTKYAFLGFLGSGGASLSGNYYYRVINEVPSTKANAKEGDKEPMEPYPSAGEVSSHLSSVKPIDLNADSYNKFVGAWDDWNPARAYDSSLVQYYSGSYTLQTVDELSKTTLPSNYFVSTHYGDWPSPEVFFINE